MIATSEHLLCLQKDKTSWSPASLMEGRKCFSYPSLMVVLIFKMGKT